MGNIVRTIDWESIDLVVFDVDGTLYDQARLRRRMFIALGAHCLRTLSLNTALTLRAFRHCREELSGAGDDKDFTSLQYRLAAERCRLKSGDVRAMVEDWIEERPLRFLRKYRFDGVAELFDACRGQGKTVAVWSDYPASAKLDALGLSAEIVVSSEDDNVRRLKPNPAALHRIFLLADVPPHRALLIGDRADHDGEAARRAGARALILRPVPHDEFPTFTSYHDAVFEQLLRPVRASAGPARSRSEHVE